MRSSPNSPPNQILIALVVAVAVFTIGLIGITLGLRTLNQRTERPTPTADVAQLPLTPLPRITPSDTAAPTLTPTVTVTPTPTATPTETATPLIEPTPTATVTPGPTPYAGPLRSNGGDYLAPRREGIAIDGALSDWNGIPDLQLPFVQSGAENYEGPSDFAATVRLAWDDRFLYFAAIITDDLHVQPLRGYDIFNGDSVELWLDADLAVDFADNSINDDDFQFGFSPGDFSGSGPEAVIWYPQRREEWNRQALIAAQPQNQGYTLEAAIPWALLGLQPVAGAAMGFAVNANDNDVPGAAAQQTILMHTSGMRWGQPTTFSTLRLQ